MHVYIHVDTVKALLGLQHLEFKKGEIKAEVIDCDKNIVKDTLF